MQGDGVSEDSAKIVTASKLSKVQDIFFLGQFSPRIAISSQQTRVFNLINALKPSIDTNRRGLPIAIVGAGIAGITAAAACLSHGYEVVVFDENSNLANKQFGSRRFIHPTVNFWPKEKLVNATSFPFLNWVCGDSEEVRGEILDDLQEAKAALEKRNALLLNREVVEVRGDAFKRKIHYIENKDSSSKVHEKEFCYILLCTGYSQERDIDAQDDYWNFTSLWDVPNHNNVQQLNSQKVLVSGCGDGALFDLFNSLFNEFSHNLFMVKLIEQIDCHAEFVKQIEKIEGEFKFNFVSGDDANKLSDFINSEYEQLNIPIDVIDKVLDKASLVHPKITLLHKTDYPYIISSSPINRLILFILLTNKSDRIISKSGSVLVEDEKIQYSDGGTDKLSDFDSYILRHGIGRAVLPIIDGVSAEDIKKLEDAQKLLDWDSTNRNWELEAFPHANLFPTVNKPNALKTKRRSQINKLHLMTESIQEIQYSSDGRELLFNIDKDYSHVSERYLNSNILGFYSNLIQDDRADEINQNTGHCFVQNLPDGLVTHLDNDCADINILRKYVGAKHIALNSCVIFFDPEVENSFFWCSLGPQVNINGNDRSYYYQYSADFEVLNVEKLRAVILTEEEIINCTLIQGKNEKSKIGDPSNTVFICCENDSNSIQSSKFEMPPKYLTAMDSSEGETLLNREVYKIGASSGETQGLIKYIDGRIRLKVKNLNGDNCKVIYFETIHIEGLNQLPFSIKGDSGSLVIDTSANSIIGIIIGGIGNNTVALKIQKLLDGNQLYS